MARQSYARLSMLDTYQNIFPWSNINEFVSSITQSIIYKSQDNSIIAINKPFGVGIYQPQDLNTKKQNQDKILYRLTGTPKYCIQDVLEPLTSHFQSQEPYKVLKSIDRYMSGIVLLSNNWKEHRKALIRSTSTSKCNNNPPFGFRAITCGYPNFKQGKLKERVGIQLLEVDELGDHKEPIIVDKITSKFLKKPTKDMTISQVELEIKKINLTLAVALVELFVSKTLWDFPRCYLSSKTTFVLGDVRFSRRIREVLGKKVHITKSAFNNDQDHEPLSDQLKDCLGVRSNAQIPLMLDHFSINLKNFHRNRSDLIIENCHLPLHMKSTAQSLSLD